MYIPVYVINLKDSDVRKNLISGRLNDLNVPFEVVEAVDGSQISDNEIIKNVSLTWKQGSRTRNLLKGEIGCVLSHFMIYRKMIDGDIEAACILEDDAEPENNFGSFITYENIKITGWDLLFIGHHSLCSKKEAAGVNRKDLKVDGYSLREPIEIPVGSYGYIIKKNAAAKILQHGYPVRKPLDYYIGNSSAIGIRVQLLSPPCVQHNYSLQSTIYKESEIIFADTHIESIRKKVREIYKWIPFLKTLRIWIYINLNRSVVILRKAGLLRNQYAKYE